MTKTYTVQEGDCISSIAFENGFFPETIWNHSLNQGLKDKRTDMNVLMPGDVVSVPELRLKKVGGAVDATYRFKYKGVPARLNLVIKRYGEPCKSEPYWIDIDGRKAEGVTGADGKISLFIAPDAKQGKLVVGTGDNKLEYELDLGRLAPIDEVLGFKQRLGNLGYDVGELDGEPSAAFSDAIRMFEASNGMAQSGEISHGNTAKLREIYGR